MSENNVVVSPISMHRFSNLISSTNQRMYIKENVPSFSISHTKGNFFAFQLDGDCTWFFPVFFFFFHHNVTMLHVAMYS